MLTSVCRWFLYFAVYSVLGWVCETVYCSVIQRKFVNRGFLKGPVCPVYGVGAVLVIALLRPAAHSLPALFLSGMVVTTVLEYVTSVLLEKLFQMRWWDYSHYRFQINGRVCLLNSLMFGGLSVVMMRLLHPAVERLVGGLPGLWLYAVSAAVLAVFAADTATTVRSLLIFKGKLEEVRRIFAEIHEKREEALTQLREGLQEKADSLEAALEKYRLPDGLSLREYIEQQKEKIVGMGLGKSRSVRRLVKAFPSLNSPRYAEALEQLRERFKVRRSGKKD